MNTVDKLINERPDFSNMRDPSDQLTAVKINDFIYMSEGCSNAYMVLTDVGRIIINAGMGWEAIKHKALFDSVCNGPTPYIIVTQGHVDHVGGVDHFRDEGTQFIAQQMNTECQRDDERISGVRVSQAAIWFQDTLDRATKVARQRPEVFVQAKPHPDRTFSDFHAFSCGDLEIELHATPGGETVDSCVVWLPQHRILFSGNVFGPLFPHFPNFNTIRGDKYRFTEPYLDSLRLIRALKPATLITGHFDPVYGESLIEESLNRLEAAVGYIHSETLRGMNEGKNIYTLMREIRLPETIRVGEGYGKISWAIRTIWESYMGWFKAQSTSELYPTQARDIYSDLVELAGLEAVVSRGRHRLELGGDQIEAALLLAEAALAKAPEDRSALQLALEAHLAIQARSERQNFWEDGWLQHKIDELRQALNAITD